MKVLVALSLLLAAASALPRNKIQDAIVQYPHLRYTPGSRSNFADKFGRILGPEAEEAAPGQFPYIVALELYKGALTYFCGGSIISDEYVVTAAHCLDEVDRLDVIYGVNNWRTAPASNIVSDIPPTNFEQNENFDINGVTLGWDIGYIQLTETLELCSGDGCLVSSIAISEAEPAVGDLVTLAGWGATCNSCSVSNDLNFVDDLPIVDDDIVDNGILFMEGIICTWSNNIGGSCGGDSGGPMLDQATGTLAGATSWGYVSCDAGPSCYSSLAYPGYRDWIREKTGI